MDLSNQEEQFVRYCIATREILYPKLLIKYHKIIKKGGFPMILVIIATNFTKTFSKIGYLWIKGIMENERGNYSHVTSVQASDLKQRPEELEINIDGVKIVSLDAVNI